MMTSIGTAPPLSPILSVAQEENPNDPKIYKVWHGFFSSFQSIPDCNFVQHLWDIHKETGIDCTTKRVQSVHRNIFRKIYHPDEKTHQEATPLLLRNIMQIHRNGANPKTMEMVETVYSRISKKCPPDDGRDGRVIEELRRLSDSPIYGPKFKSLVDALYKELCGSAFPSDSEKDPVQEEKLVALFFALLEKEFSDRAEEVERIVVTLLKADPELEPTTIEGSKALQDHFRDICTIFSSLNKIIKDKADFRNLTLIKEHLEKQNLLDHFEGTPKEWLEDLENHPNKLTRITSFNVSGLGLYHLPDEFSALPFENLEQIDLSSNELISLPNSKKFFPMSRKVISLNLSRNKLRSIPNNLLKDCNLKKFACNGNRIKSLGLFGENWTNLEAFYCSNNFVESFSRYFGIAWQNCKLMDLYDNRFNIKESSEEVKMLRANLPKDVILNIGNFSEEKLLKEWKTFFAAFKSIPDCEFVQDAWERSGSTKKTAERVRCAYKNLVRQTAQQDEKEIDDLIVNIETEILRPEPAESLFIHRSLKLGSYFEEMATLFEKLDRDIREVATAKNLQRIKDKLEENGAIAPFKGTLSEWIADLKKHPEKLDIDLDLAGIGLDYFPNEFSQLITTSRIIDLSNNSIFFLHPLLFSRNNQITSIDLSNNKIRTLPDTLLFHCNDLLSFRCDSNRLRKLGNIGTTWTHVTHFSCVDNCIDQVHPQLGRKWESRTVADLRDNYIPPPAKKNLRILITTKIKSGPTSPLSDNDQER